MSDGERDAPVHPITHSDQYGDYTYIGLTKREYFAAKAMQGMLANGEIVKGLNMKEVAADAIAQADALIEVFKEYE